MRKTILPLLLAISMLGMTACAHRPSTPAETAPVSDTVCTLSREGYQLEQVVILSRHDLARLDDAIGAYDIILDGYDIYAEAA
ncbi:MAG: hypothetical protein IKI21_10140 [Oscillospiraceae bacterium]|nr:hypothetical protein [Oscillospiraceae bacterium]